MRGTVVVSGVFLLALTLQPAAQASAVAELAFDGASTVAPVTVPFNFGNQPLGQISDLGFTLCFRQEASPSGACDQSGRVTQQQSLAPPFFVAGVFRETLATGAKTPVSFPVDLAVGQRLSVLIQWVASEVGPAADTLALHGTSTGGGDDDFILNLTGSGVLPEPCPPVGFRELCLNNNRFKVQIHFLTSAADSGLANGVKLTSDTGFFYFFTPANVEAIVKVLNACQAPFNRYWVFVAGLTDVRTMITVTDLEHNAVKTYVNPQGRAFQPIQDTSAFATCP